MVGIIILVVALYLYISNQKKWSILLYIGLLNNGFQIYTNMITGIQGLDLGFVYMIVICIYSQIYEPIPNKFPKTRKYVYGLFVFMLLSVLFSYSHYDFSFPQIIQGSRKLWFFMSFLFLRKIKLKDFQWLFEKLYYITLITSILYVIQVFFNLPVLPYEREININSVLGIGRYYNIPPFLTLFFIISVVFPKILKQYKLGNYSALIFLVTLISTQGRTRIGITLSVVALGLLMTGKISGYLRYIVILLIGILPFSDLLLSRFEGNDRHSTKSDLEQILSGDFKKIAMGHGKLSGTMTFRFAWIYERMEYLSHRPVSENIFGLGLISDSQYETVRSRYNFNMGLHNSEGHKIQLYTPDSAWGNLVSSFGYMGGALILLLWFHLIKLFYKKRKYSPYIYACFFSIIALLLNSFSGEGCSRTATFAIYFCVLAIIPYLNKKRLIPQDNNNIVYKKPQITQAIISK